MSAIDDIAAAKNALENAQQREPGRLFTGWDDTDNRPAAWKAFGEEPPQPVSSSGGAR